jgi:hypothetical protein
MENMPSEEIHVMNLTINRTNLNKQTFEMKYSEQLNFITVLKNGFFSSSNWPVNATIDSVKVFENFTKSAETTRLYTTGSWMIGVNGILPVSIYCNSEVKNEIGKKIKSKILGIPISFADSQSTKIELLKSTSEIEIQIEVKKAEKQIKNQVNTNLVMNFIEF